MSLRHLYKDLRELGIYPDIIKSNNRDKVILSSGLQHFLTIIVIKVGKYYGRVFQIMYDSWNEYTIQILMHHSFVIWSHYNSKNNTLKIEMEHETVNMIVPSISKDKVYETIIDIIMDVIER